VILHAIRASRVTNRSHTTTGTRRMPPSRHRVVAAATEVDQSGPSVSFSSALTKLHTDHRARWLQLNAHVPMVIVVPAPRRAVALVNGSR